MENRARPIKLTVRVNEGEKNLIEQKMLAYGTTKFEPFARKLLIDGYVIKFDFKELKSYIMEVNRIGSNLNQIAKRVNETRSIYEQDIIDVQKDWQKVKTSLYEVISRFLQNIK